MKKYLYIIIASASLLLCTTLIVPVMVTTVTTVILGGEEQVQAEANDDINDIQLMVSQSVERYRSMVLEEAKKYNRENYINLFLAVMMQESGGNGEDVFQCSESLGLPPNTLSLEKSIEQGVFYLDNCLDRAKCKSPKDMAGIRLALQGYNFGAGYIEWALDKDGCWTQNNTLEFAKEKSGGVRNEGVRIEQLGPWRYGDQYYTQHVLRYYQISDNKETDPAKVPLENRMEWLFPEGIPTSAEEMQPYLQQIEVKIYTADKKNQTMTLTVHKKLASQIKDIFKEMRAIRFPIKPSCTAAYCFRQMASDSSQLSYHSYGCVVDVNWEHNGASYTSWPYKPGKDKFAVTTKVVNIWKKYGWYWGGDWSEDYFDPMHFTYVNH